MKFLKFLVVVLTIFSASVFTYGYLTEKEVISAIISYYDRTPSTLENNEYTKDLGLDFVKLTDDFVADSKEEILNIYYTVMNSGMEEFTFYCSKSYSNCIDEVLSINKAEELLSQVNNFVGIYNSFKRIKTTYNTNGKIIINVERVYSKEDIEKINEELDKLEKKIIDKKKSNRDNILAIHDYIINNTKYNVEDEHKANTPSSTAIGVLFNHLATCNGYTDTAALLLDRLNIKNMRISNDNHIWNLVYLDGEWLHLDLTWDDPVNKANKDRLIHTYFLKKTSEMDDKHVFSKDIFSFIL